MKALRVGLIVAACLGGLFVASASKPRDKARAERRKAFQLELGISVHRDRLRARQILTTQCNKGVVLACRQASAITPYTFWKGPIDWRKAVPIYRKACARGELKACDELRTLLSRTDGRLAGRYVMERKLQRQCASKNAAACRDLAFFGRRNGPALFAKACKGGDLLSCVLYSRRLHLGFWLQKPAPQALSLAKRACLGGLVTGCYAQGVLLLGPKATHAHIQQARKLLGQACKSSHWQACVALSRLFYQGRGGKKRKKMAHRLARRACRAENWAGCRLAGRIACTNGDAAGCLRAGRMAQLGHRGRADTRRAFALLMTACQAGKAKGCSFAAEILEQRHPTPASAIRACRGGQAEACYVASQIYPTHKGRAQHKKRFAASLKSCKLGHKQGCLATSTAYKYGTGTSKSLKMSHKYLNKACQHGHAEACNKLMYVRPGVGTHSERHKQALFGKACKLGSDSGCYSLLQGTSYRKQHPTRHQALLRTQCERGHTWACQRWLESKTKTANPKSIMAKAKSRCKANDVAICRYIGTKEQEARVPRPHPVQRSNAPATVKRIRKWLTKACRGGDAKGCLQLAATFGYSDGDALTQRHFLRRACAFGSLQGCNKLTAGERYTMSFAPPPHRFWMRLLQGRLCENGRKHCFASGYSQSLTRTSPALVQARGLRQKSCAQGVISACREWARMLWQGRGGSPDKKKATQIYQSNCKKRDPYSCFALAIQAELGPRNDRAERRARKLYTKGCAYGDVESCQQLGFMKEEGRGGPQDWGGATQAFAKMCKSGRSAACRHLALGLLARKQPKRAAFWFTKACLGRENKSCESLGFMAVDGLTLSGKPDLSVAGRWFKRACQYGHYTGCLSYKELPGKGPVYTKRNRFPRPKPPCCRRNRKAPTPPKRP